MHFDLPKSQDGITQRRGRARRISSKHKHIRETVLLTNESTEMQKWDRLKMQKHLSDGIIGIDEAQREELRAASNQS